MTYILWLYLFGFVCIVTAKPLDLTKKPEKHAEWENNESKGDLIGGDMKLTSSQLAEIEQMNTSPRIKRKTTNGHLWIGGVIPYQIDSTLSSQSEATAAIQDAMDKWSDNTDWCIQFVPRTDETDYVTFTSKSGCWSNVGRVGGQQFISLTKTQNSNCWLSYVVAHEIGHTLGLYHEHSRPDRDNYVVIHPENIQQGKELSFKKYSTDVIDTLGSPYDYQSIMHYVRAAFSKNGKDTINPVAANADATLGNTDQPTALDYNQMKLLYQCLGPFSGITTPSPTTCTDGNARCPYWAYIGECTKNPGWMNTNCKKSCKQCPGAKSHCPDDKHGCFEWMTQGECQTNPAFMLAYCKTSCKHDGCP